jgi:pyruvate, water dikinase
MTFVSWFDQTDLKDTATVGGKGSSLGEMYQKLVSTGVRVPNGFTVTTSAYQIFADQEVNPSCWQDVPEPEGLDGLRAKVIRATTLRGALEICFDGSNSDDIVEMFGRTGLARSLVIGTPVPEEVGEAIAEGYRQLCEQYGPGVDVAVRSSSTVEDSASASFAGQYDSYLNIQGSDSVVLHWKRCISSLFTERVVSYQVEQGLDPLASSLAVVIMKMVRSDIASSGVLFTIDPDSGHSEIIHITGSYGLGELVVQGSVQPDGFLVWKEGLRKGNFAIVHRTLGTKERRMIYADEGTSPVKTEDVPTLERKSWVLENSEVRELAEMALKIENHYCRPMDVEWAKDGLNGEIFIVQARPETVHAKESTSVLERYEMDAKLIKSLKKSDQVIATGQAVGKRIGSGIVRIYNSYEEVIRQRRALQNQISEGVLKDDIPYTDRVFEQGDVLVTEMTTPDWEPMMKQASLIVTRKGGRTSHAAIIAREFGIPAILGCTACMDVLNPLDEITGSCAEGDEGVIYRGIQEFEIKRIEIDSTVKLDTKIKLNVGFPTKSLADSMLPVDGVGLARIEFILSSEIGIHPLAITLHEELKQYAQDGEISTLLEPYRRNLENIEPTFLGEVIDTVSRRTHLYDDPRQLFIDKIREGVGLICAAFYPRPVLVRLSDLKSNEYKELLGGRIFEPDEENPMIAWRGASRYLDDNFKPAFEMECEAMASVFHDYKLDNLQLMIPFCRSPEEGADVRQLLEGYKIGPKDGMPLFMMVELPSNVIDADRFIEMMQLSGGSIGTNDLVQTVYAVSRDDLENYKHQVDARSPAVKVMIRSAIDSFKAKGLEIGICGQAPSDHPEEVPAFLVECGITSISVTPDTAIAVRIAIEAAEARLADNAKSE